MDHETWKLQNQPLPPWTKFLWDIDRLNHIRPAYFELDITTRCDGCIHPDLGIWPEWCCSDMKAKHMGKRPYKIEDMEEYDYDHILTRAINERCGITLTGNGEPTMHPLINEFVHQALIALEDHEIPGFAIVTNGKHLYSKCMRLICVLASRGFNCWIRVSLNSRPIDSALLELMTEFPKTIGISLVYDDLISETHCRHNAKQLEPLAKFIRLMPANPLDQYLDMDPLDCVGRKFVRIFNVKGQEQFCCLSREDGMPPYKCPVDCRWATVNLNDAWRCNPWT